MAHLSSPDSMQNPAPDVSKCDPQHTPLTEPQDLVKKPKLREKYSVADEWVLPYDVIPIINIPGFGDRAAQLVCEQLKIQSQNDTAKLAEAKGQVYLKVRGCWGQQTRCRTDNSCFAARAKGGVWCTIKMQDQRNCFAAPATTCGTKNQNPRLVDLSHCTYQASSTA